MASSGSAFCPSGASLATPPAPGGFLRVASGLFRCRRTRTKDLATETGAPLAKGDCLREVEGEEIGHARSRFPGPGCGHARCLGSEGARLPDREGGHDA